MLLIHNVSPLCSVKLHDGYVVDDLIGRKKLQISFAVTVCGFTGSVCHWFSVPAASYLCINERSQLRSLRMNCYSESPGRQLVLRNHWEKDHMGFSDYHSSSISQVPTCLHFQTAQRRLGLEEAAAGFNSQIK